MAMLSYQEVLPQLLVIVAPFELAFLFKLAYLGSPGTPLPGVWLYNRRLVTEIPVNLRTSFTTLFIWLI
jgi:hypothetical protein